MHHSLNNHNSIVNGGFTLDNAQELKQLFTKYNVKVSFTGHIHAQNIASSASGVDIASSCFSMCDQGYGIITLADNKLEYHRFSFDPIPYLTDEEKRLLPTGDYHDYLKKLFIQTNEIQMQNFKKRFPSENDFDTVMNLINQLNYNFFIGKSNYSSAQKKEIESSISYQLVQKFLPEMKKYVDSLLAIKQNSQHVFITL